MLKIALSTVEMSVLNASHTLGRCSNPIILQILYEGLGVEYSNMISYYAGLLLHNSFHFTLLRETSRMGFNRMRLWKEDVGCEC